MDFFFVQDFRQKYRYFSSEPLSPIQVEFSRLKKFWEAAKKKLMLLPLRILMQEQAFERVLKTKETQIRIFHSGRMEDKKIKNKFYFFLQKQRTKHTLLLAAESLLLPISGIAALLPGPNVIFYILALLMIIQWQALRGINRLLKKEHVFVSAPTLREWENALHCPNESRLSLILAKMEKEYNIQNLERILWKKRPQKN